MPPESISFKIEPSPEFILTLSQIERSTGDSAEEILAKAIALYQMAVDAHKEGKRIGVLDRNAELELEVVGFEHQGSS